jgi:hypothetical protein
MEFRVDEQFRDLAIDFVASEIERTLSKVDSHAPNEPNEAKSPLTNLKAEVRVLCHRVVVTPV